MPRPSSIPLVHTSPLYCPCAHRYGRHAGWAHSLLFAAELPLFLPLLSERLQAEVKAFRAEEKAAKQTRKSPQKNAAPITAVAKGAGSTKRAAKLPKVAAVQPSKRVKKEPRTAALPAPISRARRGVKTEP